MPDLLLSLDNKEVLTEVSFIYTFTQEEQPHKRELADPPSFSRHTD